MKQCLLSEKKTHTWDRSGEVNHLVKGGNGCEDEEPRVVELEETLVLCGSEGKPDRTTARL